MKIVTFGCRLNRYESEVIRNLLKEYDDENIVIFNSCSVTLEAEKQLRQAIRKEKRINPDAIIVVVGCAAQTNPDIYSQMEEVNFVFGSNDKMKKENYNLCFEDKRGIVVNNILELGELSSHFITGFEERTRAFVQIQNGCDNHCTFCATRLARGKSVSIPSDEIVEQINKLVTNGYNEIVLTGINISDYGKRLDENINLGELIQKILRETDLSRLRLSSIDVAAINDDLRTVLFNEKRVMPHIHLSLQSGDNTILKRMARRHTREEAILFCDEIRRPKNNMAIGADLIAGFPTETEEMHQNSCRLIQETGLVFGHIFPYSVRDNTPAANMEQVPVDIRRKRAKELRQLATSQLSVFEKEQSKLKHQVLIAIEKVGRTENYLVIKLNENMLRGHKIGDVIEV